MGKRFPLSRDRFVENQALRPWKREMSFPGEFGAIVKEGCGWAQLHTSTPVYTDRKDFDLNRPETPGK
jgi:hypothetical protein